MTETKNTTAEPTAVDPKKLIDGLGTIFGGVIQLLGAMEPGMAKELADMTINGVPKESTAMENLNPDDFEEILSADDLPWNTEPEKPSEPPKQEAQPKPTPIVTADYITKIIVQKIKKNRSNSEKIGAILKTYGAAKVSELSSDKYEAFLTDVSQL
jgi:hypothetical protein